MKNLIYAMIVFTSFIGSYSVADFKITNENGVICEIENNKKVCFKDELAEIKLVENNIPRSDLSQGMQVSPALQSFELIFIRDIAFKFDRLIRVDSSTIQIPFIASVRWKQNSVKQGTLYVRGTYKARVESNKLTKQSGEFHQFSDSQVIESIARAMVFEAIDNRTLNDRTILFLNQSVAPALTKATEVYVIQRLAAILSIQRSIP